MADKLTVSNSELQAFKTCKRSWHQKYILNNVPNRPQVVGPAALGTRVHASLADYYGGTSQLDVLQNYLRKLKDDCLAFPDEDKLPAEGELGYIMLEGYFEWLAETGADEGLTVIAPEKLVQVEMPNFILQGKVDILVQREHDGAIMVLDHKTVMSFTDVIQWLPLNEQPRTYLLQQMLVEPDVRVDGAIWNMLRKVKRTASAKPPFYLREEVRFPKHQMRDFYLRLVAEVDDLLRWRKRLEKHPERASYTAYPSPSRDCAWRCDFVRVCNMLDTDPDAGGLMQTLFKKGDAYSYYNDPQEGNG